MYSFNGVVVVILLMVLNECNSLYMYAKCTFNYFYCIMDHCLLFCYCILVVYIYAHIVLYLSSRIVFLVLIELTKYKLSRAATLSHCSPTRYYKYPCKNTDIVLKKHSLNVRSVLIIII